MRVRRTKTPMPELPPSKRDPLAPSDESHPPAGPYAEVHCLTNFSFLEGASHADELAARAGELGYRAIAVTDRNTLAGAVRMHTAAKTAGVKLLVGAELTPQNASPVIVWAIDRPGYGRLARLLTLGRRNAPKGECHFTLADIDAHSTGLLAGVPLRHADPADLDRYREIFPGRCYALAELHRGLDDRRHLYQCIALAKEKNLPLAAANDVHYHVPERRFLQDVLTAIRHGTTVAELGPRRFPNAERHLRPIREIKELFVDAPDALQKTIEIADRCTFSLDELRYEYPEELCPAGVTPLEHLTKLTWDGVKRRYPHGLPEKVLRLIEHELALIAELKYEAYFLTVWDLVRFANERGILCQGRGSAANSAVCYCLGVTSVDPERIDVLFERFVSKDRGEAPDIDIDFEHERREEVLQYLYTKYGRDRAGMTGVVITYQTRSAVRDVGKALGLSLDRVDALAKETDHHHDKERLAQRFREAGFPPEAPLAQKMIELVDEIQHFPRHLSQHTGGMVITQGPLCELVPIENAAMEGRTVVEWDKDDLDALGILKVDCLALGMLTAIRKAFDLIHRHYRRPLTLATVPPEDPAVYDMICAADTVGVFQIESRAQMSMLPRLRPREFYDLVIEVAIVRPGPIQGDMVHPYLRRRCGEEDVTYPDDRVRQVLEKTMGVPIFQEQAMRLVVVAAGFTPSEADQFRRAMGAWRRRGVMEQFRQKMMTGMLGNGYSQEFAERVFRQLQGFGEYGFPESHAASFALLVYVSAWIKHHYPDVFCAAIINSQPMGFYAPAQLVADAKRHGVRMLPVDVNASDWDCTLEHSAPSPPGTPGGEGRGGGVRKATRNLAFLAGSSPTSPTPLPRSTGGEGSRSRLADAETPSPKSSTPLAPLSPGGRGAGGEGEAWPLCQDQFAGSGPTIPLTPNPSPARGEGSREAPRFTEWGQVDESPHAEREEHNGVRLRLGFRLIRGFSEKQAVAIVNARKDGGLFTSLNQLRRRIGLGGPTLQKLALADAFGSMNLSRRAALWQALPEPTPFPLFAMCDDDVPVPPSLPKMSTLGEVLADYTNAGLTLRNHPIAFLRHIFDNRNVKNAETLATLKNGTWVKVAGLVLLRQRPSTAKGITFVTLEDETGIVNLIVRREIWERDRKAARCAVVMLVHGRLQRKDDIMHVLAGKIEDVSDQLAGVNAKSRDFR
jgi:error-prone DNA polymerase